MRITIELRRRHLAIVPAAAATATAVLVLGLDHGLWGVFLVAGAYVAAGLLLAAIDTTVTAATRWRRECTERRSIEESIRLHPSGAHARKEPITSHRRNRKGAAA